ncbi:MAG: hypothetical protein Q4E91_13325, partial [Lachnospiraceae bacterium]|nr:hypothetical protein [Lachnospiraceae bacterium]
MKGKGSFAGLAALFFLVMLFSPMAAYAQENGEQSDNRVVLETVVKGQPAVVENNRTEAVLPDGTTITVEGDALPDGLLLVLELVTEDQPDILAYITGRMQGRGTNLRIYNIYFVDSSGRRYEITGQITITISLNGGYTSPGVYYLPESGVAEKLESSVQDDSIS